MDIHVAVRRGRRDEPGERELGAVRFPGLDRLLGVGAGESDDAAPVQEPLAVVVERPHFMLEHEEVGDEDATGFGEGLGERRVGVGVRQGALDEPAELGGRA
jgi:hypothetical protein